MNYYDEKGLKTLLLQKGFIPVDYYTYKIKTTIRGRGWKKNEKLMNPVSVKKDADYFIHKAAEISNVELVKDKILDRWYIQSNAKWYPSVWPLPALRHHQDQPGT